MSEKYKLTKEECLKIGGHCYEIDDQVICTNPPIYHRVCKHCGHRQEYRPITEADLWRDE